MLSHDQVNQYVKSLHFPPYPIIREYLQTAFILSFYQSETLAQTFFKGGTCLRLIYQSGRFSEDLDFTTNLDPAHIIVELERTTNILKNEFPNLSFKQKKTLAGNCFMVKYAYPEIKMPISIKLDFSSRENVLDPQVTTPTSVYPFPFFFPIPHLSLKEILAEKIRALTHRQKGRDLYDLHYLLSRQTPVDLDFINQKLAFYQESFNKDELIQKITSFPIKDLESDLASFIPATIRPTIKNLPEQTLSLLNQAPR